MTSAQARRVLLPYLPRIRSLRAAKTLLALLLHSNARGESWPSGAALARATGLPVRSVWAGLRELEALGVVTRVPRGHGRANLYQVLPCGSPLGVTRTAQDSDARVSRIVTQESRGSDSRVTGIVTPESPPPMVTGGSLSERPKPRQKRVSAQGGARRNGDPRSTQNREQKENRVIEQQASASGPPAFNGASGPEASGLGEIQAEEDGFTLWFHFEDGVARVTPITVEGAEVGLWVEGMLESVRVTGPALDPRTWRGLLQAVPPRFAAQAREVLPAVQAGLRAWLAVEANQECWALWAEENGRKHLAEQLVEQLLGSAPYDQELQGLRVGAEDLVHLRDYLQTRRPDLVEVFRSVALSAFGGPDRFKAAWQDAHRSGVGYCHSRAWGRIAIVPGQVQGFTEAVIGAWAGILGATPPARSSERPPQQALQATGPLHEVLR
jgi:hypothetical protein